MKVISDSLGFQARGFNDMKDLTLERASLMISKRVYFLLLI